MDENVESDQEEIGEFDIPNDQKDTNVLAWMYIDSLIEKAISDKPKKLTLEKAGKYLSVLGKVWNLSEYPPTSYVNEQTCQDPEEKLMDMEGFVDEYQYLHFKAVDTYYTNIQIIPKHFPWLISIDLSGNLITNAKACVLSKLPNLVALKLNRNRIEDPYISPFKHLQYLGFNSNRITSLHRIYHPNLETLDLNFNFIQEVKPEDCWKLAKLSQLELRGNLLYTTKGIEYQSLVKLYLAKNKITKLEGLHILTNLELLHLRDNPLSDLTGFSESNVNLKYLNLRGCKIEKVQDVKNLEVLQGLREFIIKGNVFNPEFSKEKKEEIKFENVPEEDESFEDEDEEEGREGNEGEVEDELEDELRVKILSYLPLLKRIDKKLVTRNELKRMKDLRNADEDLGE